MKNHKSKEAFYERLRTLADTNKTILKESQTRNIGTLIDYKKAADGVTYGIIKENHHYYIKKGGLKQDPNASDFAYIGGLSNITNFQFKTLAEADKQRNMLFHTINESISLKPNINGGGKKRKLNEDIAGEEIDNAEEKIGDLDAATDAAEAAPETNTEIDITGDEENNEPELDVTVDEPTPESNGAEPQPDVEEPAPDTEEPVSDETQGDESDNTTEMKPEDEKSITSSEIEKNLGKITNKIRKTELEPTQIKSYVNSFLSSFKDKFDDIDIEDRKEMADKILKVVPDEDVEDLSSSVPQDKKIEESETCSECGGFAQYAESRGYTKDSIVECGNDEMSSLVSGYANAHGEGQNDGDFKAVALFITPEIMDSLNNDYGHEEYTKELTPYVNSMNETTEEDKKAQIDELFGGLGQLGKKAVQNVGSGFQKVGQAVGQAAQNVKQTYYAGEKNAALGKLEAIAADLGKQIATVNVNATKAGQEPINVNSILTTIKNQVGQSGAANLSKFRTQENVDPANVEVMPNVLKEDGETEENGGEEIDFAPAAQSLGVATIKPDGAPTSGIDVSVDGQNKNINIKMNENKEKKSEETLTESEKKIRNYIRTRLEEKTGQRKTKLNESSKSETLKKLDKIIDEQFKLYETFTTNKGDINEFLGFSSAEKFQKLNPNDVKAVDDLFLSVFSQALQAAARKSVAARMTPQMKYDLLKQGFEMDKLKNPSFGTSGGKINYTPLRTENPFAAGGTGGKTGLGGV
jgi:hypothetical protein